MNVSCPRCSKPTLRMRLLQWTSYPLAIGSDPSDPDQSFTYDANSDPGEFGDVTDSEIQCDNSDCGAYWAYDDDLFVEIQALGVNA